jgi:hypothetical protein
MLHEMRNLAKVTQKNERYMSKGVFVVNLKFSANIKEFFLFNLLKPTGHVMHHQFNIQQLYALPTQYFCVLYLSENKQRLVPLTA